MPEQQILLYQTKEGDVSFEVRLGDDSVWLTQNEMAQLFETTQKNITMHLKNVYAHEELSEMATSKNFLLVRSEGKRQVKRSIKHYNLDAIISVGYRVNSKRSSYFRIWATGVLRDYLMQGYALNQKKLKHSQQIITRLEETLGLFKKQLINSASTDEARGLLSVITEYARTFVLLNQFDQGELPRKNLHSKITYEIDLNEAELGIDELKQALIEKGEGSDLFGRQKDNGLAGVLGNILQTFDGKYLYPTVEEQGAHLLYLIIKNHPFTDGNKRIGALLFIWFLQKNKCHLKNNGEIKINDNALAAIALLIAQSDPSQKDAMIDLIINLIGS